VARDIETWVERSARLDLDGIDFDTFVERPLSPEALRCLRYMHDVEYHTVCYLRDLLVTSAHADPEITTFLSMWCYEEYFHGDAIARVLDVHGEVAGNPRVAAVRQRRRWRDKVDPIAHLLGSAIAGPSFIAIHMSWGALNEWTTQAGYARLIAKADHPTLTDLLRRIMRQEGRHIDFYASKARERLTGDRRAQRLARFALEKMWKPVGAGVMPEDEVAFLVEYLFGDGEGRAAAARVDNGVDRLPGLAGLHLASRAVERYAGPAAAAPRRAA
jgi:hypothetical protein